MCLKLLFLPPFAPPSPSSLAGISSLHSSTSASYASSSVSPSLSSSSSFSSSSRCPSSLSYSPTSPSSAQFQPPPPLSSLCSSWGSQNGPPVQGLLLHSSLEANGWYLDFRTVGTFVHTPDERETSRHPMNKKSASVNEPRRWQSGFWARQASCAVSELSNNYVTRPREFEACPGSDVHRQLFGRPSKSFPADIWSAGGTDLKSALAGAGFGLHAAERLMRMEQPQVPNCPSLRPGPVGTGFWSVRTRSPANSSAREGKAGKLCED